MLQNKKSQLISEVFKYILVGLFSVAIIIFGYRAVTSINEKGCKTEMAKFEIDIKGLGAGLRYGTKELQSFSVPCSIQKIYFIDSRKDIDLGRFDDPLMKDSIKSVSNNIFLIKDGKLERSFDIGSIDIDGTHYICLLPKSGKISVFAEGNGNSVKVSVPEGQMTCQ